MRPLLVAGFCFFVFFVVERVPVLLLDLILVELCWGLSMSQKDDGYSCCRLQAIHETDCWVAEVQDSRA